MSSPERERFRGDAVREADSTVASVVVRGSEETSPHRDGRLERWRVGEAELRHVEGRVVWLRAGEPDEMIQHLGYAQDGQRGLFVPGEKLLDITRCWFVLEQGEDGVRVENDHRRRSAFASSARA